MTGLEGRSDEPARTAELTAFRETFLALFAPHEAKGVRQAGVFLQRKAQAGDPYHSPEPLGSHELLATARDLALLADYLKTMSRAPEAYEGLTETEVALAGKAGAWASEIGEFATAIAKTVAHLLSKDKEETP